jgi:protein-disulfide isomerase
MPEKDFFDMSGKQGFVLGLAVGIAATSIVGFGVMFAKGGSGWKLADNKGNVPVVNTNTAPTPAAPEAAGDFTKVAAVTKDDHIRGNANAKITLLEYSDFQCPFCQRHAPTMDQLLAQYKDQVRLVYRHFPLTSIHPQAQGAAEASECAAEQGKFWEYHDKLFANQSALDVASLKKYAGELGLKQAQFDSCVDSKKYAEKVNKQAAEAQASGITGTPGTFVNDQLVKGAYPAATFTQMIDAIIAKN